jgi:hypothetical protein
VFPILDRFLAQFFSQKAHPMILQWAEYDIINVFETIGKINFIFEDDGRNKGVPRLAVYNEKAYRYNRDQYIEQLIPRLQNLAKGLQESDLTYQGIDRNQRHFTSVDLQMAIFMFGKKNPRLFKQFYKNFPIPCLTIQTQV